MASIYSSGVEYLRVQVKAEEAGLPYDPTSDAVYWAFIGEDDSVAGASFVAGDWETISGKYYARILFGSDVSLTEGRYTVILKVVTDTETIIKAAGSLTVKP